MRKDLNWCYELHEAQNKTEVVKSKSVIVFLHTRTRSIIRDFETTFQPTKFKEKAITPKSRVY